MSWNRLTLVVRISLVFLIWTATPGLSQSTGSIVGRVMDAHDATPLAGANIVLYQAGYGTSSRENGRFEIPAVHPGTYTVIVTHIGFHEYKQRVTIKHAGAVLLQVELEPSRIDLSEVLVQAERPYSAASSSAIRQFDMQIRPARSAQDMLRLAPGLFIAQHAGGGKAEQIFLRGFDADHGTDVALFADGIPVNMVSHGHGQGYADLHFLIPEIVESVDVFKGPYFARFGNLATAGAVTFRTKEHVDENLVRIEGGGFNTSKLTTVFQIPTSGAHQGGYFAGQFYNTDGAVESPQNFQRFNIFGKFHTHIQDDSRIAFSLGAFSSAWDGSGQIPKRAVDRGLISRFGAIDDLEGGTTSRQNLNFSYTSTTSRDDEFLVQAYASRYDFKLFSNFTFYLNNPVDGDMIEQTDQRTVLGLNSRYHFRRSLGSIISNTTAGGGFRADDAQVALWNSPNRVRETLKVDAEIIERNLFLWLQQELIFSEHWRLQLGVRRDYFTFNVEDHLERMPAASTPLPHASGTRQHSIFSPKLNLVYSPRAGTDLFVNSGSGFHSNDARLVVIAQRTREIERALRRDGLGEGAIRQELLNRNFDPTQRGIQTLPHAVGGELGLRQNVLSRAVVSLAAWTMDLQEELVFVGDEGTTEVSGRTRRLGIDLEGRAQLTNWLWADLDISLSKGRFLDEPAAAAAIPLAPTRTSTGGFTLIHPGGLEGSLRYRHIGDRPANETRSLTADGHTLFDLSIGYRIGSMKLFASLENLFNATWNEAQFDTQSRLRNEALATSEIHFTPGHPRNMQLGASYRF